MLAAKPNCPVPPRAETSPSLHLPTRPKRRRGHGRRPSPGTTGPSPRVLVGVGGRRFPWTCAWPVPQGQRACACGTSARTATINSSNSAHLHLRLPAHALLSLLTSLHYFCRSRVSLRAQLPLLLRSRTSVVAILNFLESV